MQDKIKIEILDLTEDTDEELKIKEEPLTSIKENPDAEHTELGESSGLQKSPSGRFIRNIDKCLDKAIAEIKKGQSLIAVASQYGIPQDVLYNKLVSRSLPKETEILTPAEENGLVKWILKANNSNSLIFKHQLMEKVGKLKKVVNITPIFAKSKFGRMWYEHFMKNHPEIYENDGILMLSDRVLAHSFSKGDLDKNHDSPAYPEDMEVLTPEEEQRLVEWIITANNNNSLVFKYQLMKKVGKMSKVTKLHPGFTKSKFGRMWYERFLKNHPEVYENDELLLPSEQLLDQKSNGWPDDDSFDLAQSVSKTSTDLSNLMKFYGIKDAVVVLHDFRKETNPPYTPYMFNEKKIFDNQASEYKIEIPKVEKDCLKHETADYIDIFKCESEFEDLNKLEKETKPFCSIKEDDVLYEPEIKEEKRERKKMNESTEKPVCVKCARAFCNIHKLKRHILTVHQPKEHHQALCLMCNKTFGSKYHLSLHMRNVHRSRNHECEECGKEFKFKSSLRKHQRAVHEGFESWEYFFCDICGKGFKYKNSLEAHIIYGHLKEKKKFSCSICSKSFVKHSLMLRHKTRHSKIKPMACLHCSKTYSRKYLLREHIEVCAKKRRNNVT